MAPSDWCNATRIAGFHEATPKKLSSISSASGSGHSPITLNASCLGVFTVRSLAVPLVSRQTAPTQPGAAGEKSVIAGNSALDEGMASVEYGVSVLKTQLLMVMGHNGCGAVTAAMDTNPLTPSLDRLIQPIRENINGSSDLEDAVKRNALASASTLIQRSAVLAEAKASGALKLVVGCFQLSSGVVSLIE